MSIDTSIRGAYTSIAELIEKLEAGNEESIQVYDELQDIESSTADVFGILESNLHEMQN